MIKITWVWKLFWSVGVIFLNITPKFCPHQTFEWEVAGYPPPPLRDVIFLIQYVYWPEFTIHKAKSFIYSRFASLCNYLNFPHIANRA